MVLPQLHDTGEEYVIKNGIDGESFVVGLYNTSQNQVTDSSDMAGISSEPNGGQYTRQTATFSSEDIPDAFGDGDWGVTNDSQIVFDTSQSTNKVDGYFIAKSFQSDDKGDSSAQLHLISTGLLQKTYNLDDGTTNISKVTIRQGFAGIKAGQEIAGDKLFIGDGGNERVYEYTLSTPFDTTTNSLNNTLDTSSQALSGEVFQVSGVEFDVSGYRLLLYDEENTRILQYTVRDKYDISSIEEFIDSSESPEVATLEADSQSLTGRGAVYNNDGTKLYEVGGGNTGLIFEYTLSERWDVTTATFTGNTVNTDDINPRGMCWNNDGSNLYIINGNDATITTYGFSTAFDLAAATSIATRDSFGNGTGNIRFNYNGTRFYQGEGSEGDIVQVELDDAFDLSASSVNNVNSGISLNASEVLFGITLNNLPKFLGGA